MKSSTKIWLGVGVFAVVGSSTAPLHATETDAAAFDRPASIGDLKNSGSRLPASDWRIAAAKESGEAGPGGEGGEGGEAGIDVAAAETDPVEYGVALQVIAAHYYAGLAAYEAKETDAGAQMFAHGLSEVYVEMEAVFRKRGVTDLGKKLEAAVQAASSHAPNDKVRRSVNAVLTALAAAKKASPKSGASTLTVGTEIVANLINRAATQYNAARDDKALEPYLDGLGFVVAARTEAAKLLPQLRRTHKQKAATIEAALKLAQQAYPGMRRPDPATVPAGQFLGAASAVMLAASNWK